MGKPTTDPQKYRVKGQGWRVKIAGKAYRLGPDEGPAEQRRRQLVGEWLQAGGPGAAPPIVAPAAPDSELSVTGAVAEYLERGVRATIHPHHRTRIKIALAAAVDAYGSSLAADFGSLELIRVRDMLLRRKPKPKRNHSTAPAVYSRRYVNSLIGTIKTAWRWLAQQRLVPQHRAGEMREVRGLSEGDGGRETADVLPAPAADVAAALEVMSAPVAAMVRLQLLTGMRPGEVCGMTRAEVSTSPAEVLHPPNALPTAAVEVGGVLVWVYAPSRHKTRRKGKARLIALGPAAIDVLTPFVSATPQQHHNNTTTTNLFRPVDAARGRKPGGKEPGPKYTVAAYANAVRRACHRAGVPPWQPGQLRHNYASDLFPTDPLAAMATLGHEQMSMTKYYYAATLRRAAEQAAKAG